MDNNANRFEVEIDSHIKLVRKHLEALEKVAEEFLDGTADGPDILAASDQLVGSANCLNRYLERQEASAFKDLFRN